MAAEVGSARIAATRWVAATSTVVVALHALILPAPASAAPGGCTYSMCGSAGWIIFAVGIGVGIGVPLLMLGWFLVRGGLRGARRSRGTVANSAAPLAAGSAATGDLNSQLLQMTSQASRARPSAERAPDPLDRLAKLAGLKDRGILSDAEFAAEKAKILGES